MELVIELTRIDPVVIFIKKVSVVKIFFSIMCEYFTNTCSSPSNPYIYTIEKKVITIEYSPYSIGLSFSFNMILVIKKPTAPKTIIKSDWWLLNFTNILSFKVF